MKRNIFLSLLAMFIFTVANAQNDDAKYDRHVLLEEFTTEYCKNCPPLAAKLKEILAKPEYKEKVTMVAHHAGFQQDWLTTDADYYLTWFYNTKSTFAPALMFDRYPFFKNNNAISPVGSVSKVADIENLLNIRLKEKSAVSINITSEFDNDTTLTVRVKGDRTKKFTETDPVIFVYVTENNIVPRRQAGALTDKEFRHMHVTRAYNDVYGVLLPWDGDTYDYECKLAIKPEWNKSELEIVASISAFNETNCNDCVVENTRSIPFLATTGIEDTMNEKEVVKTEYFTTDGIKTSLNAKGLYIVKSTFSDGSTKVKKINF